MDVEVHLTYGYDFHHSLVTLVVLPALVYPHEAEGVFITSEGQIFLVDNVLVFSP